LARPRCALGQAGPVCEVEFTEWTGDGDSPSIVPGLQPTKPRDGRGNVCGSCGEGARTACALKSRESGFQIPIASSTLIADDIAGIAGLVQMGILEIHTWNSIFEDLERPNRIAITAVARLMHQHRREELWLTGRPNGAIRSNDETVNLRNPPNSVLQPRSERRPLVSPCSIIVIRDCRHRPSHGRDSALLNPSTRRWASGDVRGATPGGGTGSHARQHAGRVRFEATRGELTALTRRRLRGDRQRDRGARHQRQPQVERRTRGPARCLGMGATVMQ
jgi:hypothetical protein